MRCDASAIYASIYKFPVSFSLKIHDTDTDVSIWRGAALVIVFNIDNLTLLSICASKGQKYNRIHLHRNLINSSVPSFFLVIFCFVKLKLSNALVYNTRFNG